MFENALSAEAVQEALEILQHEFPLGPLGNGLCHPPVHRFLPSCWGCLWASCWWQESLRAFCPFPKWLMRAPQHPHQSAAFRPLPYPYDPAVPLHPGRCGHRGGYRCLHRPPGGSRLPFVARLVESSLRELSPNIVEAAQSMGASPCKIICKVMLPESVPSLLSNGVIALTTILGYTAMSGILGAGDWGKLPFSMATTGINTW